MNENLDEDLDENLDEDLDEVLDEVLDEKLETNVAEFKKERAKSFKEGFAIIKDDSQPFSNSALTVLSDMSPEDLAIFQASWPAISAERRRKVVEAMALLAEDDVKLVFNEALLFMLDDSEAEVRGKAVEGLWEDETRDFMSKLMTLLTTDPDEGVRERAALGLSNFAYLAELGKVKERSKERLRQTLTQQADPANRMLLVRRRALEALGYFGQEEQTTRLIEKAYDSDDELLKISALKAMGRSVNGRWLPEVGKEMRSPDAALRYEAATAAGEIGAEEMVVPMLELTKDEDREVQLAAIWALGQIGGAEAKGMLSELGRSEDEVVVSAAKEALVELDFAANPLNVLSNR